MSNEITFNIWSILILFGAFHGFVLAFYFLFSRIKKEQIFFGLLLLVISLNLTEYAFTISELFKVFPDIIGATYPLLFLMGPFYYLHVRKLAGYKITKKSFLHYIPALLWVLYLLPFYLQSGDSKLEFYLSNLDLENPTLSFSQFLFIFLHFLHMSIYVFISWKLIDNLIKRFKDNSSSNEIFVIEQLKKATQVFIGFLLFFLTMLILLLFIKQYRVEFDYVIVLVLSIIIYVLAYITLKQSAPIIKKQDNGNGKGKYNTSSLDDESIQKLKTKLQNYMETERPYLNGELKISDLSEQIDIPSHHLSQLINQEYQVNFFDFINNYRIAEAKKMLVDEKYANDKIFAIAIDSGFNNKASFNRVFKRLTGFSPTEYKEKNS